jgi:hypothetical protein
MHGNDRDSYFYSHFGNREVDKSLVIEYIFAVPAIVIVSAKVQLLVNYLSGKKLV